MTYTSHLVKIFTLSLISIFSMNCLGQNTPIQLKVKKAENQWLYAYSLDSVNTVQHFAKVIRYEDQSYIEYKENNEITLLNTDWASTDSSLVLITENNGNQISLTYEKVVFPDSLFYNCVYEKTIDRESRLSKRCIIPKEDYLFYGKLTSESDKNILPEFLLFNYRYKPLPVFRGIK